jgi:hypothetical protein
VPIANYTFAQAIWTMIIFFAWVILIWLLIVVFTDLFRRRDIGGWAKAGWTLFVIILPYLGIFVYLIAEGRGMGERNLERAQQQQQAMDSYVRTVAGSGGAGAADQIARAKELLDNGTITQEEFDKLKAAALA